METFIKTIEDIVGNIALISAAVLEILGIAVIVFGALKSIIFFIKNNINKNKEYNVKIDLGNFLALGLEFKMGAEILKTVVIRTLDELLILGAIILLRAILAVLIHWEIKNEKKHQVEEIATEEPEQKEE